MTHRKTRVAIIGAGWAGLAAAVELCSAGISPVVFEAAKQVGGRARRVDLEGCPLDNGQHILIGAYRETLRLIERVGGDPARLFHRFPLELEHALAGFRFALPKLMKPFNLAVGLLTANGVPFGEKMAAARFMQAMKRRRFHLSEDCAASDWFDRHALFGKMRRYFWDPLCLSALNTPPDKASARVLLKVLRDSLDGARADTDFLLPATDLSALFPDPAVSYLAARGGEVRLSSRVESWTPRAGGIGVNGEHFDHAVFAVAPYRAARLLECHAATRELAGKLSGYAYEPIGTVYAAYSPDTRLPDRMRGMECDDAAQIGQWVFDRGRLDDRNRGILAFVFSSDANGWQNHDNGALAARLHHELEKVLSRSFRVPAWTRVIVERRATFSCRPHLFRPTAGTAVPGLWLAGDYAYPDYPATLEGAVRSGVAAASEIIRSVQRTSSSPGEARRVSPNAS